MRALIASGTGRYADPWHPFLLTSPLLADLLSGVGFDVSIDDDVDAAMNALDGIDLLVVNAGDPWRTDSDDPPAPAPATSIDGFAAALERGMGVLAVHCAVSSLRDYPEWAAAVGAMWVPGSSFHPPHGTVEVTGLALPGGASVEAFAVEDERYSRLQRIGRSTVVAAFGGADAAEPAAWTRTYGAARIAVDVLGHDERSYASAGHRDLVARLARWAVGRNA